MTTTVDGKKRCGDNEKRLIKEWAVANNGMKTQDEFYLTQLGKQLQEQGFGSRSIAPVVIHANKEVQKSQMGPNGIGVGAKRPPEDGITGMSLNGGKLDCHAGVIPTDLIVDDVSSSFELLTIQMKATKSQNQSLTMGIWCLHYRRMAVLSPFWQSGLLRRTHITRSHGSRKCASGRQSRLLVRYPLPLSGIV